MVGPEQERPRSVGSSSNSPFIALGSGGRPIGSLLNPYDAVVDDAARQRCTCSSHVTSAASTPSLRSSACLAYEEEEVCFIWYHRVDLQKEWVDVRRAFNAQFPTRQRSGFQGIQCRYYRYLYDTWKVPKIRLQKRLDRNVGGENTKKYGLRQWTKRLYPWMNGELVS